MHMAMRPSAVTVNHIERRERDSKGRVCFWLHYLFQPLPNQGWESFFTILQRFSSSEGSE